MKLDEQTLKENYIYKGRILNLRNDSVLLPNGAEASREIVEHPGGVCVLPIDSNGEVHLVNQFRYPYKKVLLEAPAGKKDYGEEPLECGIRELKEETGAEATEYTFAGECYPSPGYTEEKIYLYIATGLSFGEVDPDEDEFLNNVCMPITKAYEMVINNEIRDAKTQIVILKAYELIKSGKLTY
jgi:ADP-ribose pyrophosphatase